MSEELDAILDYTVKAMQDIENLVIFDPDLSRLAGNANVALLLLAEKAEEKRKALEGSVK